MAAITAKEFASALYLLGKKAHDSHKWYSAKERGAKKEAGRERRRHLPERPFEDRRVDDAPRNKPGHNEGVSTVFNYPD